MTIADTKAETRLLSRQSRKASHSRIGKQAALDIVAPGLAAVAEILGTGNPGIVGGYLAVGSDLDVGSLMAALETQGWSLAMPVVLAPEMPLVFRRWQKGDTLTKGSFGIDQPGEDAPQVRPDLVLAPLLAFDDEGYRLGQGGGFYDRTLEQWRTNGHVVKVLGVAFAAQRVDAVPRDDFDQRLNGLVTENGWRNFGDVDV